MPTEADMMHNLNDANRSLAQIAKEVLNVDMSQVIDPQHRSSVIGQLKDMGYDIGEVSHTILDGAAKMDQMGKEIADATNGAEPFQDGEVRVAKTFNLKVAQFGPTTPIGGVTPPSEAPMETAMPEDPTGSPPAQGATDPMSDMQFDDGADVKAWLEEIGDPNKAIEILSGKYSNKNQMIADPHNNGSSETLSVIKDAVNDFYSNSDEQVKLDAASTLFDMIVTDGDKPNTMPKDAVPSELERVNVANIVKNTNEVIKKLAESHASVTATANKFNLKTAQHKALQNVVVLGPNNHIDEFTGQLINDYHLIERNKGFGLRIGDLLNIDFEKIWRNTIMDKYEPNYIENRFEVDKNIPLLNNLHLPPGVNRRMTPPEYSHTEARLEAARTKMNSERGYAPSEKGDAFNWKKANTIHKKKVSTAQGIKPLADPFKLPGEKTLKTQTVKQCPMCQGELSKENPSYCPNCKASFAAPVDTGEARNAPTPPGEQAKQQQIIQTNQQLNQPLNKRVQNFLGRAASAPPENEFDGIFFDGSNFVCYANNNGNVASHRFLTIDEAEQFKAMKADPKKDPGAFLDEQREKEPESFKQMPASPQVNPALLRKKRMMQNLPSDPHATVQDCHHVADSLGIEG
jgi:hypothetical protein